MREGFSIAKQSRALNPIQFNAIAIILLVGLMPFAIAFITNAGAYSDGRYESSMKTGVQPHSYESRWLDNGGDNWTSYYQNLNTIASNDPYSMDCAFVKDGFCQGVNDPPINTAQSMSYFGTDFFLPMTSNLFQQTHYIASDGSSYISRSGDEEYSWRFGWEYFSDIETETGIDKLKFTFVDDDLQLACNAPGYKNITFYGSITVEHNGQRKTFDGYEYKTDNKYEFEQWNPNLSQWEEVCKVGIEVVFDFTSFETLVIHEMNQGRWNETFVEVSLIDFSLTDDFYFSQELGSTALPFAGDGFFRLGVEHQEVDVQRVGFVIRGATLILAFITFAIAMASTPYWDPFKNFFNGRF